MDLVPVEEVRSALDLHAGRYLGRVYTEREVAECRRGAGVDPRRLAARFAAKEAVMKLLRPQAGEAVSWRSIGVHGRPGGVQTVRLDGEAARLAARQRMGEISVSLTQAGDCAGAVATAQVEAGEPWTP